MLKYHIVGNHMSRLIKVFDCVDALQPSPQSCQDKVAGLPGLNQY